MKNIFGKRSTHRGKLLGVAVMMVTLLPIASHGADAGTSSAAAQALLQQSQATVKGAPLNAQQEAVKTASENLKAEVDAGKFDNLAQVLQQEVKFHEQNGFKFGGVSFSVSNGSTLTKYNLTQDVLHQEVYSKDAKNNLTKVSEKTYPSFVSSNTTKFSHLTPALLQVLTGVKLHKDSPQVDSTVAHAYTATSYDGYQSSDYLNTYVSMYYFGSGYHDVDISTHNSWTGADNGEADPGAKDGMDVEWNPNNLYMGSVVYQPNTYTSAGPFGWNGVHDIAIDSSSEVYGVSGGYYVEPDHCSKSNYVEVYLYPVSSSVYGQSSNYYGNYIHDWNWYGGGSIGFSIGYGAFSISYSSSGTGSWRINNWGTYVI